MPKALEEKLWAEARKKFPGDKEKQRAYVYGTLRKTGWTPSGQSKEAVAKAVAKRRAKGKR